MVLLFSKALWYHNIMEKKRFKILFIFPNIQMYVLPLSIAYFSSLLKSDGHEVELFEAIYPPDANASVSENHLLDIRGPVMRSDAVSDNLIQKTESYDPDLIAMSLTEAAFPFGIYLLNAIRQYEIPTIVGGVFPTFAPEKVIACEAVSMVCVGEGETALTELCRRMQHGQPYNDIPNLWIRYRDGHIIRNPIAPVTNLDTLPPPDYALFRNTRFYPPHGLIPFETHRGCPYQCTYCNSPALSALYQKHTRTCFFRKRSMAAIRKDLDSLTSECIPTHLYFTSDTFLAWKHMEFDEFIEIYSDYKIPFFCNTRPETITPYRMEKLRSVGLAHLSIGLEHGNEKFRREVIRRRGSNETILKAFHIANDYDVKLSVDNIIGFPGETRELAFDTIRLNRQFEADIRNCYIFAPYHGTRLRDLAIEQGYLENDPVCGWLIQESLLNMPQFPKEQIWFLKQNFSRYISEPESCWPDIEKETSESPFARAL